MTDSVKNPEHGKDDPGIHQRVARTDSTDGLLSRQHSNDRSFLHRTHKHPTAGKEVEHHLPLTTKDVVDGGAGGDGGGDVYSPFPEDRPPTLIQQGAAALFYATASLVVIFVNKVREVLSVELIDGSFWEISLEGCVVLLGRHLPSFYRAWFFLVAEI